MNFGRGVHLNTGTPGLEGRSSWQASLLKSLSLSLVLELVLELEVALRPGEDGGESLFSSSLRWSLVLSDKAARADPTSDRNSRHLSDKATGTGAGSRRVPSSGRCPRLLSDKAASAEAGSPRA